VVWGIPDCNEVGGNGGTLITHICTPLHSVYKPGAKVTYSTVRPIKKPTKTLGSEIRAGTPPCPLYCRPQGDFLGDLKVWEGVVAHRVEDVSRSSVQSSCVISTVSWSSNLLIVVWSSKGGVGGWVGLYLVEVSNQ
jgi:hypothetical protein